MKTELLFFLFSGIYGMELMLIYNVIQSVRNTWNHKKILIVAEDMIFWLAAGIFLFTRIYKWNHGILRWYFFAGVFLGMVGIAVGISPAFVKFVTFLLKRLKMFFSWVNIILGRFIKRIYKVLGIEKIENEKKGRRKKTETQRNEKIKKKICDQQQ